MIDYVIYGDTDSVTGDSVIETDKGKFTIEQLWIDSGNKKEYKKDKHVGYLNEYKALSLNDKGVGYNKINYILKHKVYKNMFRVRIGNDFVDVTEDHSIMIKRDGKLLSIRVDDIKVGDKLIKLVHNDIRS